MHEFTVVLTHEVQSVNWFSRHRNKPHTVVVKAAHYHSKDGELCFCRYTSSHEADEVVALFAKGEWSRVLREDYSG